ncbi:hypothetical protein [Treponema bryantii]|uniref:hypothetical protein n=1 Tax=Treponema bryantii TaxID=163 RepID=UPI0003B2FD60|nr:hypothetical protein [Treponema bryantii]
MKHLKFSHLFAAFAFVAVLSLAGCKPVTEEVIKEVEVTKETTVEKEKKVIIRPLLSDDAVVATWSATYEKYEIGTNTFKSFFPGTSEGSWDESYTGNTLCVRYTSATSGYIYMKYTKALCATHSDFDHYIYTYDTDAPDVGKWYAIAFKDLNTSVTPNTIKLSGAAGAVTSTATLDEAIDTFTIENGYFDYFSDLVKE